MTSRLGRGEVVEVVGCGGLDERYAANCGRRRRFGSCPLRDGAFKPARLRLIAGEGRPTPIMVSEKATHAAEESVSPSQAPDYALGPDETSAINSYEYLLLTVEDVASVLDLSEHVVRKRVARGTLPGTEVSGSHYVRLALV